MGGLIPEDIQDDVLELADTWADQLYEGVSIEVPPCRAKLTIARAILAERKRCAEVARAYLDDLAGCGMRNDEPDFLAAAIMNPDWKSPTL